ncbi:MAG: putative toxin-antitoxin system toxin component, PIN family [Ginsengibacter sp.]
MSKIIIDANVWIRYARTKDIAPLLNRITAYNFLPVVNNYLLSEIFNALVENKWMRKKSAHNIIGFVKKISLVVIEKAVFGISPDPKDNYLFDVAIQNGCVFMITDDSELLDFILKPIPVHNSKWFLEMFPVI